MGGKIFKAYIINAAFSGFYIIKGTVNIISASIKLHKTSTLSNIMSSGIFNKYREIADIISGISNTFQSVVSLINLYVFGYPSLVAGAIALLLSSCGMFWLTKKQTEKTAGYYITMTFSYMILGAVTLAYIAISILLRKIRS